MKFPAPKIPFPDARKRNLNSHCCYCPQPLIHRYPKGKPPRTAATVQHILPKRHGGKNDPSNLKPCCRMCNELLAIVDDCPAALHSMFAVWEVTNRGRMEPGDLARYTRTWPRRQFDIVEPNRFKLVSD